MKEGQKLWTRDELILAINLYVKLPFGKMHKGTPAVIDFANLIGRTPSSIALKLGNFASFDPTLQARGIKGASNSSKLDRIIWDEFYDNWDAAFIQSETLLAKFKNTTIEQLNEVDIEYIPKEGLEKERVIRARLNQSVFRKVTLATYSNTCCITGMSNPQLLIASHILPWSKDEKNRLNPMNGLLLNPLHDKAFETGLLAIDEDYKIKISSKLKADNSPSIADLFLKYEHKTIHLPKKFRPSLEFLSVHLNERFII